MNRSAAAKKGWVTRRRNIAVKKFKREINQNWDNNMQLFSGVCWKVITVLCVIDIFVALI